jgi:hypothetical protein
MRAMDRTRRFVTPLRARSAALFAALCFGLCSIGSAAAQTESEAAVHERILGLEFLLSVV